jgi:uncharacterized protein
MPDLDDLAAAIDRSPSMIVAFSGGVDSSLVAAVAARRLGPRALAVTAVSASLAAGELDGARSVARSIGIEHETIATDELAEPAYRANRPDRCYHCKTELYGQLERLASARGFAAVASGTNTDDLGDWRPGLRAASEHGVRHPLVDAGIGKGTVRRLARELGIPSAEKPAMPCLASRVPYGTPVEAEVLAQIDRAERGLRALGLRDLRVRHFADLGVIELSDADLHELDLAHRAAAERAVIAAGYRRAEISPEPLRSGSLNRLLPLTPVLPR